MKNRIRKIVEKALSNLVICEKCKWNWEIEGNDDDPFLCHKCGYDNKKGEYDIAKFVKWKILNNNLIKI